MSKCKQIYMTCPWRVNADRKTASAFYSDVSVAELDVSDVELDASDAELDVSVTEIGVEVVVTENEVTMSVVRPVTRTSPSDFVEVPRMLMDAEDDVAESVASVDDEDAASVDKGAASADDVEAAVDDEDAASVTVASLAADVGAAAAFDARGSAKETLGASLVVEEEDDSWAADVGALDDADSMLEDAVDATSEADEVREADSALAMELPDMLEEAPLDKPEDDGMANEGRDEEDEGEADADDSDAEAEADSDAENDAAKDEDDAIDVSGNADASAEDTGTAAMPLANEFVTLGAAVSLAAAPLSTVADAAPLVMDAMADERSPEIVAVSAKEDTTLAGAAELPSADWYIDEM